MIDYNFAKLVNGKPRFANFPIVCNREITIDGKAYPSGTKLTTNRADILLQLGYKPTMRTLSPGGDYPEVWEETETAIIQRWEGCETPTTQEQLDDALAALETLGYSEEATE